MGTLYLLSPKSSARKDGPRIVVEKDGETVSRMPIRVIDNVVVQKNAQLTTSAVFAFLERKIPIFYMDTQGKILGTCGGSAQNAQRLLQQVDYFRDPASQINLTREIVAEKIQNQYRLIKQYANARREDALHGVAKELKTYKKKTEDADDLTKLRGIEGIASRKYFGAFPMMIEAERWAWQGRSQHPAKDPVNAMLNYGYAFLAREVRVAIAVAGLDERIGFFHANNGRKDSLTFDLMDFFRQPVIDRFVLNLINRGVFKPEAFEQGDSGCRLQEEMRALWCSRYEEYMVKPYREYDEKNTREMLQARVRRFAGQLFGKARDDGCDRKP